MSAPITKVKTNAKECSLHEVVLDCDKLWAMGQEEAIRRLSKKHSSASSKYELIFDFGARAARIAAAYASYFLMGKKAEYMEGEIKKISTWSNQQ
jgi:hypothetical protein